MHTGWSMCFFSSLYSMLISPWTSMRTHSLFVPVCPWFCLLNVNAPGIGGPCTSPTPSLWMNSFNYYSCRYHLWGLFKCHDSPSKPWEETPSCLLALCKGYCKHRLSPTEPLAPPTHPFAYLMFSIWALRSRGPFFGFSQCGLSLSFNTTQLPHPWKDLVCYHG